MSISGKENFNYPDTRTLVRDAIIWGPYEENLDKFSDRDLSRLVREWLPLVMELEISKFSDKSWWPSDLNHKTTSNLLKRGMFAYSY